MNEIKEPLHESKESEEIKSKRKEQLIFRVERI
jgi:hypothetical protein